MRDKKRILVVTSTFPRWKGDKDPPFVFELCSRLAAHYQVHVLASHFPGSKTDEIIEGISVKRFRYFFLPWERLAYQGGILPKLKENPFNYGLLPFFFLGELFALIRLLQNHSFNLIHAHWLIPQGLVSLLGRRITGSRIPVLCTSHGGDLYGLEGKIMNRIKRWVISNSDAFAIVSRSMREDVARLGAGHKPVQVIPMGVDLKNRFVPADTRNSEDSILFVGRLVEKKGVRYLIEAASLILDRFPDANIRIAGDGPDMDKLKRLCRELGVNDRVRFLGAVENESLPALYQTTDVVVFPSLVAGGGDREGFGLVLVEALGCECAAVVTDLPAMRDIVLDGKNGLVVPQKNAEKIAEKVIYLLDRPEVRKKLGQEGRRYVLRNFDWMIIVEKYRKLIESVF